MNEVILTISICAVVIVGMLYTAKNSYSDGYRKGQIDALNGKIKYQKTENADKETVWEKIKEEQ